MSLTALFERISGKQKKRQADRRAGYRGIIVEVADGKEPDPDDIEQILIAAGKTLDDLQNDVELLQRRREMQKKVDAVPKLATERKRVEKKIAEADSVLDAAEKQHEETTYPLHFQLDEIKKAIRDGDAAQRQLVDTCNDPVLLSESKSVTDGLREATTRRAVLQRDLRDLQDWAEADRQEVAFAKHDVRVAELKDRADRHDAKASKLEAELVEVQERIAALETREREVRERMLVP